MLGPDQGDYATALAACSAACDQRDTCLGIQLEFTSDVAGSLTLGGAPIDGGGVLQVLHGGDPHGDDRAAPHVLVCPGLQDRPDLQRR